MRVRPALALVLWLTTFAASGGCSNQAEGEICAPTADDCQSGLTCQPVAGQNRCCPPNLALSKAAACAGQHPLMDASTAVPDASPADEDALAEAAADAGAADGTTE
jgi:hypothetical protein